MEDPASGHRPYRGPRASSGLRRELQAPAGRLIGIRPRSRRDIAMRRRPPRLLTAALAVALGMGTACTFDDDRSAAGGTAHPETTGTVPEQEVALRLASSLRPFDACGELLDHVRTQASAHADTLGVMGFGRGGVDGGFAAVAAPTSGSRAAGAPAAVAEKAAAPQASGAPAFSGTNV